MRVDSKEAIHDTRALMTRKSCALEMRKPLTRNHLVGVWSSYYRYFQFFPPQNIHDSSGLNQTKGHATTKRLLVQNTFWGIER